MLSQKLKKIVRERGSLSIVETAVKIGEQIDREDIKKKISELERSFRMEK